MAGAEEMLYKSKHEDKVSMGGMMCASCAFTLLVIKDGQFSRLNEKIKVQRGEISFLLSLHNVVGRIFTSMTFNTCCYSYECVISYGKRAFTNVIKFTNILT